MRPLEPSKTDSDLGVGLALGLCQRTPGQAFRTGDESNEELSAQLAEVELASCDQDLVGRVAALIRATGGHVLIDWGHDLALSDRHQNRTRKPRLPA